MIAPPQGADLLADGLCTVAVAARLLAVSRSFLYATMDAGELCYVKLGRSRRIPRRALLDYAGRHLHGGEESRGG